MPIDLANEVIKETYKSDCYLRLTSMRPALAVRESMQEAKRFVLDAEMSELLAHLSVEPYDIRSDKRGETLSAARRSSRLPFEKMFVQYDGRAFRRGLLNATKNKDKYDLWGKPLEPDSSDVIDPVGWLFERHTMPGSSESFISCTEYFMDDDGRCETMPFEWIWSTEEWDFSSVGGEMGDRIDVNSAQLAHGVTGYIDKSCAIFYLNEGGLSNVPPRFLVDIQGADGKTLFKAHYMVAETGGVLRYMFAFLSTLNEIPVSFTRQRPTAAYLANGKRRVAVDHEVVRLVLPNRKITYATLARQIVRDRAHPMDHPVKGHWRTFQSNPAYTCIDGGSHLWGPTDATGHADCTQCDASRTWIADHRRGDKSLGSIEQHRYLVGARRSMTKLESTE